MHRTIHRLGRSGALAVLLVVTVGAATVVAAPSPSGPGRLAPPVATGRCAEAREAAREEPTVANLQAVGRCEIDRRLATLEKLQKAVDASTTLTDDHEAALEQIIASTGSGLTALRAEIDGATTVAALRDDLRRIVEDFRVYVLVARQAWLVIADDTVAAAVAKAETGADRIAAAIDAAAEAGKDVAAARVHLAAMTAAIDAAVAAVDGDAAGVVAQTPAGWNAGEAKPVLDAARASIREARSSLRTALREARSALADLR